MQGRKHTYNFIKKQFENQGCILLSTKYINANTKLHYICNCGGEHNIKYNHFKRGVRCKACGIKKTKIKLKGHIPFGNCIKRVIKANKERIWTSEMRAKVSASLKNPNITDEERKKRKEGRHYRDIKLLKWRKEIFERDCFTCQHCNIKGVYLNAHHINGWNLFLEQRYLLSNGITFCVKCHTKFHSLFGKGNNNCFQLEIFQWGTFNED